MLVVNVVVEEVFCFIKDLFKPHDEVELGDECQKSLRTGLGKQENEKRYKVI